MNPDLIQAPMPPYREAPFTPSGDTQHSPDKEHPTPEPMELPRDGKGPHPRSSRAKRISRTHREGHAS